jgi:signal peptidase I
MRLTAIRVFRAVVRLALVLAVVSVFALAAMPHVLSVFGREMFVVRGSSMHPQIPVGSVIFDRPVDPTAITVGDIVTFRQANGSYLTHRVIGIASSIDLSFITRGDGSSSPDPVAVPASAAVGVVEAYVPQLGFAITALGSTLGAVSMIALVGGLLLMSWFVDELASTVRASTQRRVGAAQPVH